MSETGLHQGLELRLRTLASRISELRRKLRRDKGAAKLRDLGEIVQLESREKRLEDKLSHLDSRGKGFWPNATAEVEKKVDDVAATLQDFMIRLDREQAARSKKSRK